MQQSLREALEWIGDKFETKRISEFDGWHAIYGVSRDLADPHLYQNLYIHEIVVTVETIASISNRDAFNERRQRFRAWTLGRPKRWYAVFAPRATPTEFLVPMHLHDQFVAYPLGEEMRMGGVHDYSRVG